MAKIKKESFATATMLFLSVCSLPKAGFAQSYDDFELDQLLEEVIVTAQRRAENVQDVPISMTVFSEEQIANANMTNAADLTTLTPSLTVDTRFGYENTSFAIRGFTQALRTTASVATYFADVVAPRGQTAQTSGDGAGPGYLFDLQNIQVLKGPQGTLFGRNTTGGAILLTPQEPTDSFEGHVEGSVGNFNSSRLQSVVNVPLMETFKMRLGVDSNERDGHLNNTTDIGTDELGSSDYTTVRLSFLWDAIEDIENYTLLQHVDSESTGYSAALVDCNPSPTTILGITGTYSLCEEQLERQRLSGDDGFYDVASAIATPKTIINEMRFINTTSWELENDVTVKNIFGFAHLETDNGSAVFGTDWRSINPAFANYRFAPGISVINPEHPTTSQESYVEEVQIQGTSIDEKLDWQIGVYYENSRPDGYSGQTSAAFLYCDLSTLEGDPTGYMCYDTIPFAIRNFVEGSVLTTNFKTEFLNKAVYGQATYDVTDEFSTTVGLRYTRDEAEGVGKKYRYTFNPDGSRRADHYTEAQPRVESEEPTGMIDFAYRPREGVMTYFKYTRGYRQGSVNLSADSGVDTHDPEYINAFELGAKMSFGGPVPGQLNVAIFDNELKDMQLQFGYVSPTAGPTTAIANAGKAVSRGVEIDAVLKLHEDVTLNIAYSHLSTELKEQIPLTGEAVRARIFTATGDDPGMIVTSTLADKGDELPFAPKNTWVATLNYLLPIPAEMGVVSLGATWTYVGAQRTSSSSSTYYDMLPDYELLNLNASWLGIYDSNFDTSFYATNVLDKEFVTFTGGSYNSLGMESRQVGLPRMYGLRVRYNF